MLKYKTAGKRLVASILDEILLLPISYFVSNISSQNQIILALLLFLPIFFWTFYFVMLNGKLGYTIGKKIMNLKILDVNEQNVIGIKRAFCRDGIWFVASFLGLIYSISLLITSNESPNIIKDNYDDYLTIISTIWILVELITMLTNSKRRALHDYLAGSVVINLEPKTN